MKNIFRILGSAKQLWRYYVVISIFTILVSITGLLYPLLSGFAVDEIRKGSGASIMYVSIIAGAIFALDLLGNIFSNIGGYLGDQMTTKLNKILSLRYYEHLMILPQRYFDTELSGKIINRLNRSITQITNFMQMMSNNFLQFIFSTIFALIIVAFYSVPIALLLLSIYPVYIWMTFRSSSKWQKYQKKKNLHIDIASGRFAEAISQVKVVKSFIQEKRELKFFDQQMTTVVDTNKPQSSFWHRRDAERRVVLSLIFLAVYMYIFILGANGSLSPGQVVALILYAMQIRIPIFTISFMVENTQRAIADSNDYFEIMSLDPQIEDVDNAKDLVVSKGGIQFKDVSFAYDKISVLSGINLTIAPNTKIALVGESGEGKTTITNLLMRLYEPQEGQIFIDDQPIDSVTQNSLRKNIAVVFQDPALFSGTIYENITYSNPNSSQENVEKVAKAANAHEFISKLEKGYMTEIGEHGLKLSGGQKQRIAIARALLKDAPILILDEATSSLDSKSEAMVQDALKHLMKGRTTIIIAHRLSTIQHVDQIITIANGKVGEVGSPEELAISGGIYEQLLNLQMGDPDTRKKRLREYEIAG